MVKVIIVLLILLILTTNISSANTQKYNFIIQNNPFSPNRTYLGENNTIKNSNIKIEELKKNIILKGFFKNKTEKKAILEIKPPLKHKLGLEKEKLIVKEGDKLNNCRIQKITKSYIMLDKNCSELIISFKDNPRRKLSLKRNFSQTTKKEMKIEVNKKNKSKKTSLLQKNKKENKKNPFLEIIKSKLKSN